MSAVFPLHTNRKPVALVINPSPTLCHILYFSLRAIGWGALSFRHPVKALRHLYQQADSLSFPDALIVSIDFSSKEPLKLVQEVRQSVHFEALRHLPILALVSGGKEKDLALASKTGVNILLPMPFKVEQLVYQIPDLLPADQVKRRYSTELNPIFLHPQRELFPVHPF